LKPVECGFIHVKGKGSTVAPDMIPVRTDGRMILGSVEEAFQAGRWRGLERLKG
jgi:hypothetical protein